jgi:hypothetical protein
MQTEPLYISAKKIAQLKGCTPRQGQRILKKVKKLKRLNAVTFTDVAQVMGWSINY